MDAHLSTLNETLHSVATLQRHLFTAPRPQPFTNAFLDSIDPSLVSQTGAARVFIRECDPFERNFFHFPPAGSLLSDDAVQAADGDWNGGHLQNATQEDPDACSISPRPDHTPDVLHRFPQIKNVAVPTPLRPSVANASRGRGISASEQHHDARTFLLAAQRLSDNYQRAPRARRHIRLLLKRHKEVLAESSAQAAQAAKLEHLIARLASREQSDLLRDEINTLLGANIASTTDPGDAAVAAQSKTAQDDEARRRNRLREMQDSIAATRSELNTEEMEVLALEEMRDDVLAKRDALRRARSVHSSPLDANRGATVNSNKTVPSGSIPKDEPPYGTDDTASSGLKASTPSAASIPSRGIAAASRPHKLRPPSTSSVTASRSVLSGPPVSRLLRRPSVSALDSTNSHPSPSLRGKPAADAPGTPSADGEPVRETAEAVESRPGVVAASQHQDIPGDEDVEPDDETERLAEKVWEYFGDHLRFVAPGTETANGKTTLDALRRVVLASPRQALSEAGARADDAASSASTANTGPALPVAEPTVLSGVTALILLTLLRSKEPSQGLHSIELPIIKARVKEWLEEGPPTGALTENGGDGDALATKAIYAMVAKKVLKIRRAGGKATVEFS
ncbi:unnamed protein product [Parajaminaea phylloscopi]